MVNFQVLVRLRRMLFHAILDFSNQQKKLKLEKKSFPVIRCGTVASVCVGSLFHPSFDVWTIYLRPNVIETYLTFVSHVLIHIKTMDAYY